MTAGPWTGAVGAVLVAASLAAAAPVGAADRPALVQRRPRGRRDSANAPNALMGGVPPAPITSAPPAPAPSFTPSPAPSGAPMHLPVSTGLCKKLPEGKRVRLSLKTNSDLGDLLVWISSITCKQFLLPGTIPSDSRQVTVTAPRPITRQAAYQLFLGALDSVGLTVEADGRFLRIIETSRAKMSPIPFYGDEPKSADAPADDGPTVTRLVRVEHADADEAATVLKRLKSDRGDVVATDSALIITDSASNVDRMLKVLRELDVPAAKR